MVILCLQRKNLPAFNLSIVRICQLLPLCLIFLLVSTTFSQYRTENWSTEQGLPYKTVRSVLQTRDGYVWAATLDGLARFDGVRFAVFNTANSPGLKTNRLSQLAEAADGSLWICGEESGLFHFKSGGVFTSISTADGLPSNAVLAVFADPTVNRLTILTMKGIAVREDEKIISVETLPEPSNRLAYRLDTTGAFCAKEKDVLRRHTKNGVVEYKLPDDSPETLLAKVYEDRTDAVWIGVYYPQLPRKAKIYIFKNGQISSSVNAKDCPAHLPEKFLKTASAASGLRSVTN